MNTFTLTLSIVLAFIFGIYFMILMKGGVYHFIGGAMIVGFITLPGLALDKITHKNET